MPRRRGFPFFRLGLLVVIGSVLASVVTWYTAFADDAGDITTDIDTDRRALLDHFVHNFLFAGTIPSALFWIGVALMVLGGLSAALRRPAPRA